MRAAPVCPSKALSSFTTTNESAPSSFTMVAVSSAEMLKRMKAGLLKGMKPCVYNPASHTLRLIK